MLSADSRTFGNNVYHLAHAYARWHLVRMITERITTLQRVRTNVKRPSPQFNKSKERTAFALNVLQALISFV